MARVFTPIISPEKKEESLTGPTGTITSLLPYYRHQTRETADEPTFLSFPFPPRCGLAHRDLPRENTNPRTTGPVLPVLGEARLGGPRVAGRGLVFANGNGGGRIS